jgi:hypothetical protein
VGDVHGEADCIAGLGEVALENSDHNAARERYEQAVLRYRRIGDVLGETNCNRRIGDIALARSDRNGARARYEDALAQYSRIPDPYSIGWTYTSLARIARDEAERKRHLQAAREAWLSAGQDDLVH